MTTKTTFIVLIKIIEVFCNITSNTYFEKQISNNYEETGVWNGYIMKTNVGFQLKLN